ncbi:MAG: helix-turn-helix domain-containing protein [Muribaculaceae bacterium]
MAQMDYVTIEELEDKYLGAVGTPRRDAFEADVRDAIQSYHIGEAIRAARKERNMTQEELADLMGVKKAQVSRIERGSNPTFGTVIRAFKALGMAVSLTCGNLNFALE